jgi:hypothetical protein
MKPDAATIGSKNRISEQMIQINGYRANHNEPNLPPILLPK